MSNRVPCFVIVAALLVWSAWGAEEISSNLLVNADFRGPTQKNDEPAGWSLYAGGGKQQQLRVVALDGDSGQAVLLADGDAAGGIGLRQAVPAQEGLTYEASMEVRGVAEASSQGYGSVGYFGWNSLSKQAAMYYMTGDEFHAREFCRLAFPDAQAQREIAEIDGERIENKDAPLSEPYHYNAHLMILFWD
jgi:hypothetical protein